MLNEWGGGEGWKGWDGWIQWCDEHTTYQNTVIALGYFTENFTSTLMEKSHKTILIENTTNIFNHMHPYSVYTWGY